MLTRLHYPPVITLALALALALGLAAAGRPARGDDRLKDNDLSARFFVAGGLGDSWSGEKISLDYGYRLVNPIWLDLQLAWQTGARGDVFETLAGGKWKLTTPLPLVPYLKAGAGPIFLFPQQARSAIGLAVRAAGGADYFVLDWLGFGVEAGLSLGHGFFDSSYRAGHGYAVIDIGAGVEFQF